MYVIDEFGSLSHYAIGTNEVSESVSEHMLTSMPTINQLHCTLFYAENYPPPVS